MRIDSMIAFFSRSFSSTSAAFASASSRAMRSFSLRSSSALRFCAAICAAFSCASFAACMRAASCFSLRSSIWRLRKRMCSCSISILEMRSPEAWRRCSKVRALRSGSIMFIAMRRRFDSVVSCPRSTPVCGADSRAPPSVSSDATSKVELKTRERSRWLRRKTSVRPATASTSIFSISTGVRNGTSLFSRATLIVVYTCDSCLINRSSTSSLRAPLYWPRFSFSPM
mmetsp:Transcript_15280/g.39298  ORF Transcript_15280/g.39298 Transcript_15280/m.39298 type:complete len:227 (-) Transcript_15280:1352-2032(-)